VDAMLNDGALRVVLPTIISAAVHYASACDDFDMVKP
jgi:hypothetical protein